MRAKRIKQEGILDTWQLQSDGGTIDFKYNKNLQSIRINSQERKVYFIEETGIFFSHLHFLNEYSLPVGDLYFDHPQHLTGLVSTQNEKFRFEKTVTRVLLYDRKKNLAGSIQLDKERFPTTRNLRPFCLRL